jgi:hypothetical protein
MTVLETGIKKIAGIFFNIAINLIFDGANVSKTLALLLSATFSAIVGGADPNHFQDFDGQYEDWRTQFHPISYIE